MIGGDCSSYKDSSLYVVTSVSVCYITKFKYYFSFIHDQLHCHVYLLMHCINGASPRQVPVHILMSLVNKYLCIFLSCLHGFSPQTEDSLSEQVV